MEASATSEKIQRGFDKKIRLNEERQQLVQSIRDKYKGLIQREKQAKELTNTLFEPIITPLKSVIKKKKENDTIKKEESSQVNNTTATAVKKENLKDNLEEYVKQLIGSINKTPILGFIVLFDENNPQDYKITTKISKYPVQINFSSKAIEINHETYPLTKNLAQLLFTGKVNDLNPTRGKIQTYNKILKNVGDLSNISPAVRRSAKYKKFVHGNENKSYNSRQSTKSAGSSQYGEGPDAKNLDLKLFSRKNQDVKYIYWNSPSELIHRLCLLISTKKAGNTNHQVDSEIESIENQLREANIIE